MLKKRVSPMFLKKVIQPSFLLQAMCVGVIAGVFVVLFKLAVELSFGMVQKNLVALNFTGPWFYLPVVTTLGGAVAGWLVFRFAPETSGSGIPYIKAVLSRVGLIVRLRSIVIKFLAGVAGIGTGMPLGREGPSVQLGAGAGALVAKIFGRRGTHGDSLIAAGSGAALGAVFNAPIAGTVFVFEELLHRFSAVMLFPVLVATVTAASVMRFVLGNHPSFDVPAFAADIGWESLIVCLVLGGVCGVAAVLFSHLVFYFRQAFAAAKFLPYWAKPALAGFIVGMVGLVLPLALGAGNQAIEALLYHQLSWDVIVVLLVVRFVLTPFCFGSGTAGGIFLPMLMIGAFIGCLLAYGADALGAEVSYGVIALSGMAAFMAAVARTPITAVVMVFEMTGGYGYILPIMLATATADYVAGRFGHEPIYTLLQFNYMQQSPKAKKLSEIKVTEAVEAVDTSLSEDMVLSEALLCFESRKEKVVPVINAYQQLVGAVSAHDVDNALIESIDLPIRVCDVMNPSPLMVMKSESLYQAYFKMNDSGKNYAFVIDNGHKLLGILQISSIERYEV